MSDPRFCSHCGAAVAPAAVLCRACGSALPEIGEPTTTGRSGRRRVQRLVLALGSFVVLALVWVTASYLATRRAEPRRNWSNDPRSLEQKIAGTLTVYTLSDKWEKAGQGSGFLIDASGVGVTNVHVLRDAARAYAVLGDGRAFDILGISAWDADKDLAVFRLGRDFGDSTEWPRELATLRLSNSAPPGVGDWVATLTSPKGLSSTLSDGLVSAFREEDGVRYMQISAPISPGSSGGPVFDRKGDVVGVTVSQVSEGQNLNFAVPIDSLRPLLERNDGLDFTRFQQKIFQEKWGDSGLDRECVRLIEVALEMFRDDDYKLALRPALATSARCPDAPLPYLVAGGCYQELGDIPRAAASYYAFLARAGEEHSARESIVNWLREQGLDVPAEE